MKIGPGPGTTTILALSAMLLVLGRPAFAQSVGDRVRVTVSGHTAAGPVTELGESTFKVLVPQGWHWEIARDEVERLEVSTGTRRATLSGLGLGVGAGLVVSLVRISARRELSCGNRGGVGAAIWCNVALRPNYDHPPSKSEILTKSTLVLGAAGLILGSWVKRDVWQTVTHRRPGALSLDPVVDVRSVPDGGAAVIVGTRIRF